MNIIVTGSISYDDIMDFPGKFADHFHPEKLHQINISFVVDKLVRQLGGTGTNIAYNIAKIFNSRPPEGRKLKILGAVGKDGGDFLDFFEVNNVDTSGIITDKKLYTATGKVMTDERDNQIWSFYYGASITAKKISLKEYLTKNTFLVISANHHDAFLNFQKEAIKLNIPYLYDPGMALTWISDHDLKNGVLHSQYLIGNDYEMAMILKRIRKTVKELTSYGLKIITTLGEKGVRYEEKSQIINHKLQMNGKHQKNKLLKLEIPSFRVKKVVDPTGAGDAFRGGFVAGLAMGFDVEKCLKLGNVMASFAIEKYGTVNHRPSIKDIERRLLHLTNSKS